MSLNDPVKRAHDKAEATLRAITQRVNSQSSGMGGSVLGIGDGSAMYNSRTKITNAQEQSRHFSGISYTAIRPIAQRIAGQPVHVARKTKVKGKAKPSGSKAFLPWAVKSPSVDFEIIEDHPLSKAIADPNEYMTGWALLYVTVASLEITGRAFWYLDDRGGKNNLKIHFIPTYWVDEPVFSKTGDGISGWVIRPGGTREATTFDADNIIYFNYPDPSNPFGAVSPLQAQATAVIADESIQTAQVQAFENGIFPGVGIRVGRHPDAAGGPGERPALTDTQRNQIVTAVKQRYAGAARNGEPLILDALIEGVERLSNTPAEMDYQNSSQLTKSRIMQGHGVNPIIVGEIQSANRASAVAADDHFCSTTVNPKIELINQCLTQWLGPKYGSDIIVFIEPARTNDPDYALREEKQLRDMGLITDDEVRQRHGFAPMEDAPSTTTETDANAEPAKTEQAAATATDSTKTDVQAAALNGAQVTSLLDIIGMVADGTLPSATAAAMVQAAFPLLTAEQVNAMLTPLQGFKPAAPEPASTPPPTQTVPPPSDQADNESETEGGAKQLRNTFPVSVKGASGTAPRSTKDVVDGWLKAHEATEKSLAKTLRTFLDGQIRDVAKGLQSLDVDAMPAAVDRLFNVSEQTKALKAVLRPLLLKAMAEAAGDELDAANPTTKTKAAPLATTKAVKIEKEDVDPLDARLPKPLSDRIEQFLNKEVLTQPYFVDLTEGTRKAILQQINEGIQGRDDDGVSMSGQEVADRLLKHLGDNEVRAEAIARTEATGALNAGQQVARDELAELGLLKGKEWLSVLDDDTRHTHSEANGQLADDDGNFTIGGSKAPYPGHYSLPAKERVRCRCTVLSILDYDAINTPPTKTEPEPIGAELQPFGPSKADVSHLDAKEIAKITKRVLGFAMTPQDIADAIGAPPDAKIEFTDLPNSQAFYVEMKGDGYEAERKFWDVVGRKVIKNEIFKIEDEKQGKGLGASVFGRQVENSAAMGFTRIDTLAARGEKWNGYYTWARLGYDTELPAWTKRELPEQFKDAKRVSDLMATKAGRDWWKANGETIHMSFDLAEGSLSRRTLAEYLKEAKAKGKDIKMSGGIWTKAAGNGDGGNEDDESTEPAGTQKIDTDRVEEYDSMEGDDEILDAIWDKIGAERAAKKVTE